MLFSHIVVLLLILALLAIAFLNTVYIVATLYGSTIASAPFVPVQNNALPLIIKTLDLKPNSILYDLGCGEGRVLLAALQSNETLKAVGIEIAPFPRLLSKWKLRSYKTRATILNKNFFKTDFSEATHIFVYLGTKVLAKLEPQFDQSLKPGTRVVSCDFVFPHKAPIKTLDIPYNNHLSKKLYVYEW